MTQGQTFTKMLNQKVLPDFVSVEFDPTRKEYDSTDLIGYYQYDDEGVKARPVKVVEGGVLKTFLLSRSLVGQFVHSNGHGRRQAGFEVVSRQSNLIVESTKEVSVTRSFENSSSPKSSVRASLTGSISKRFRAGIR